MMFGSPLSTLDIETRIRDTGSADVRPDGIEIKSITLLF